MSFNGSKLYQRYLLDKFQQAPWSKELFFEMLSRRGFLVSMQEGVILFSAGHHKDDLFYLKKYADNENISKIIYSREFSHSLIYESFSKDKMLRMFQDKIHIGMTSIGYEYNKDSLVAFEKNIYGWKEPIEILDLGLASFIKALPLASVRTKICCDGHDKKAPEIEFTSDYHALWLQYLDTHFFSPRGLFQNIGLILTDGNYGNKSVKILIKESEDKFSKQFSFEVFDDLFLASMALKQIGIRDEILSLKSEFISLITHITDRLQIKD